MWGTHWEGNKIHTFSWRLVKRERDSGEFVCKHCLLRRFKQRRQWIVTKDWGKTEKGFYCLKKKKNCLIFTKHAIFATETSRQPVARVSRQNTSSLKIWKKISKCFSWLEGLPTRQSWAELRKSLCTPCNWTFHSWTSHQNQHVSSRL